MSEVNLVREVQIVKKINGKPFYAGNIPETMRQAQEYSGEGGFIAPLHLLTRNFPHEQWFTANSEDISGFGEFQERVDFYVVTHHGGVNGGLLLDADVVEKALYLHKSNKGGLNNLYAAVINDVLPESTFRDFLQGGMPDGTTTQLYTIDQVLNREHQEHLNNNTRFGIVRTLQQAKTTNSKYQKIQELENPLDLQVIAHTGGGKEAKKLLEKAKQAFSNQRIGVWNPFNNSKFDPNQSQGRLLFLGYNFLSGYYNLSNNARFVGVRAQSAAPKDI